MALREEKPVLACDRLGGDPEHMVPGAAARAAVEPHRGLLLDRSAARFDIVTVKPAAQKSFEVRQLELLELVFIAFDGRGDVRHEPGRGHEVVDRLLQARRDHRPGLLQQAAGAFIQADIRDTGLKSLKESGFPHDGAPLLEMPHAGG
jgi:hypothetical protein